MAVALCVSLFFGCSNDSSKKVGSDADKQPVGRQIEYKGTVSFFTATGDSVTSYRVALAESETERSQGLMDVRDLPSDRGMIFIFEEQDELSFWMANTPLSLDIIFVNEDFEVVRIHESTRPYSQQSLASDAPARYVVELLGGQSVSWNIIEGSKIRFVRD